MCTDCSELEQNACSIKQLWLCLVVCLFPHISATFACLGLKCCTRDRGVRGDVSDIKIEISRQFTNQLIRKDISSQLRTIVHNAVLVFYNCSELRYLRQTATYVSSYVTNAS